jgi:hypothetical protein
MVVGYIKLENVSGIFSKIIGIEIRKFDNNYVIVISKDNNLVRKRLVKYIRKLEIKALVFSKELEGSFKEEVCEQLGKKIDIVNGKRLMEYMEFEIAKYILNKQGTNTKEEYIYIIFKKETGLDLNFLKRFIENFKVTNIVTNDIERLKNVQENLLENDGILIAVSNNKKKALKRAKYVININLNKEELEKYTINRNSIIINIRENVKYSNPGFDGININYFDISCPDEYVEKFEQIGSIESNFDLVKLYESILLCNNMQKQELEAVYERIKKDDICVAGLIGNNGRISDEELQKIHTANIDKMRKLV